MPSNSSKRINQYACVDTSGEGVKYCFNAKATFSQLSFARYLEVVFQRVFS